MNHRTAWIPRALVAVSLVLVTTCSKDPTTSTGSYGNNAAPTTTATSAAGSAPAASGSGTVNIAEVPTFGKVLVAADGRTLYLFEKDTGTTSACTGACATAWPALVAPGAPSAGTGVDKAKLGTANGQVANQVTYNGHLLYEFAKDSKPGDVNGVTIPEWYPVNPAGDKIDDD